MRNSNIKFKLKLLFVVLFISIGVLGYKSIDISQNNKDRLKNLREESEIALSLQSQIIIPLHNLRQLTQSLVMAANKDIREKIRIDLEKNITRLNKNFSLIEGIAPQIKPLWSEYKKYIAQMQGYLEEEFEEGAYINITTISKEKFELLSNELLRIQKDALNKATTAYEDAQENLERVKIDVVLSLIFIILFALIVGWYITNNILKSIYTVQNGLNNFFMYLNDNSVKVNKIEINSKDEFQQMATIINENIAYIQTNIELNEALIKNATKVLEDIKSGNLGNRLIENTNNQSLNELKNMINNVIDNLEDRIQFEINKRLENEQMLIQQSKLASMGEMIGNIAHQWRQPLAQISAIHMNMKVTYDFDNFTNEYLNMKLKEANKLTSYMSKTISDFQNFFKPHTNKEYFSIKNACDEAYYIVESSLKYHGIEFEFSKIEDCEVFGYSNEFSQVILNILSNAKNILLERKIKSPKIELSIKLGEQFSIIKIEDNAGGIDEEVIDKIFEPYFTTRHKTQGTGIGLYMSKNIIERNMQGFINVKNSENGAIFTVKVLRNIDK